MRREYLTVTVDTDGTERDGDQPPEIVIDIEGPAGALPQFLRSDDAPSLDGTDVDVVLRRGVDGEAVLSLARRLTGEFLLEANVDAPAIESLVSAASDNREEPRYRVRIDGDDVRSQSFEKRTLLVYDAEGNLDRETSLIPSGVEL